MILTDFWAIIGTNILLILASIGSTITLFLWNRSEAREDRKNSESMIKEIQKEMKDFHGRMERQDAEFRGKFLLIESKLIGK